MVVGSWNEITAAEQNLESHPHRQESSFLDERISTHQLLMLGSARMKTHTHTLTHLECPVMILSG